MWIGVVFGFCCRDEVLPALLEGGLEPTAPLFKALAFEAFEAVSRDSVSISLRFDFQTITTESAPEDVKKSPPGEKLQDVAAPSCP